MIEYPEDVMKAARAAFRKGCNYPAETPVVGPFVDSIASAIMAERQRCHDLVYWMSLGEGSDFGLQAEIMNGDIPNTPPPGYPGN